MYSPRKCGVGEIFMDEGEFQDYLPAKVIDKTNHFLQEGRGLEWLSHSHLVDSDNSGNSFGLMN